MSEAQITLSDVLLAQKRLAGQAIVTPLIKSDWLSGLCAAEVYLKLDNLQVTRSFKFRGALNALIWAQENHLGKIFTASAGNHGLGVAEASLRTQSDATICIPLTASPGKRQKLQSYNTALIQHGNDFETTEAYARRLTAEKKGFYVSAYNNAQVIAGGGTIALEMLSALPQLSTLVVSVGGGGLIAGIAIAAKAINPAIRVIGVVASNSPAMKAAINAGRITQIICEKTLADSLGGNIEMDSITFPIAKEFVDDWVAVEEQDIAAAIFDFLDHEGMLIEGAASVTVAAVSKKMIPIKPREKVGIVICGGNIARQEWREILVQHLVGITAR